MKILTRMRSLAETCVGTCFLVISSGLLTQQTAQAWGALGHEIVAGVGARLAESGNQFWTLNSGALVDFSNAPDRVWKRAPFAVDEKPTHWFHFDVYSPNNSAIPTLFDSFSKVLSKYGDETLTENGTAPWRADQFHELAEMALRSKDLSAAVQWAGVMAHYVGDLSQPLHVTKNYDGQLTGQKGIHAWFETANLKSIDAVELTQEVERLASDLLTQPAFRAQFAKSQSIARWEFSAAARSFSIAEELLSLDRQYSRKSTQNSQELLKLATERLADGAATYALILDDIWSDKPDVPKSLNPQLPEWREPNYSSLNSSAGCVELNTGE